MRFTSISRHLSFVPATKPASEQSITQLEDFLLGLKNLVVLTGAGISTESGIPDYRSAGVGLYATSTRRPVQHATFMKSVSARQLYWARNYVGWPAFASKQPNICHDTLSVWERQGVIKWLVTQNVDALHHKAGSSRVTELHGCTHRIRCMQCDRRMGRWQLQDLLERMNDGWRTEEGSVAPDGDVNIPEEVVAKFRVADCPACGGILKPDVVFFGDNVSRSVVDFVYDQIDTSDGVLVAGSSLFVYSGYRFAFRAKSQGKRVAIVNIGSTRADDLADLKVDAACGDVLPKIKLS